MDEIIQEVPVVSSHNMEILSEFRYVGEIRKKQLNFRLGVFENYFVVATQSEVVEYNPPYQIPEDATEKLKEIIKISTQYNYWSGDVFFDLRNYSAVLEKMKQRYKLSEPTPEKPDSFDVEDYGDKLVIAIYSVFPHNVGVPIVSFQLRNAIAAKLDVHNYSSYNLWVSPETGEKMLGEMIRIEPEIKERLNKLK